MSIQNHQMRPAGAKKKEPNETSKNHPHEYLCYSICESGRTAVFEVAVAVAVSPSAGRRFGQSSVRA